VANVADFGLVGGLLDMTGESWDVLSAHVLEVKVPVLFRRLVFQADVAPREVVASVVSEPDIHSFVGQFESKSPVRRVDDPLNRGVLYAMHQ